MKILAVTGVPGVGKSTVMQALLATYSSAPKRYGLLDYQLLWPLDTPEPKGAAQAVVLGYYDHGQIFSGTDRLSMAVQPHAEEFLRHHADDFAAPPIAFEGDRLCNVSFLTHCSTVGDLRVVVLIAPETVLAARRAAREAQTGKVQDATWLRGRTTKVIRVAQAFHADRREVATSAAAETVAAELRHWLQE